MVRVIFVAVSLALALAAHCQLFGPWHGELRVGANVLPLVLNIGEQVTLDSPAQGAKGIPAELAVECDSVITVAVPLVDAKYQGVLRGEKIEGKFTQSGMTFALTFSRGLPERPQTPQPPFAYATREVRILNPLDGAVVAGTLTLPVGYALPVKRDIPAVVMVSGSGQQDRDEELYRHRPFAVLSHHLALHGIASLRYDDRACGQSTGSLEGATTATFASDAKAAVRWMRDSVAKIGRIGILGHSEGGTIGYMLGAEGDVDFVVSMAGPAMSGREVLLSQNRALLQPVCGKEVADDYIAALELLYDYMVSHPEATEWPELKESTAHLTRLTAEMVDNLALILSSRNPWLDFFIAYDPSQDIARMRCPVFAINGSLDMQVDSESNLAALRAALRPNADVRLRIYPGLNHMMQHATTGHPSEYSIIDETISPEVLDDIASWILSLGKRAGDDALSSP